MIKFFRKIRQKLLQQNRMSQYLAYAVGEIILVTIGILIALQINTANQQRIEKREKSKLLNLIKEEIKENLEEATLKEKSFENSRKRNLILLEISSGAATSEPIDSIRKYGYEALAVGSVNIKSSRLSASKESGQFSLLNEKETKVLTDYETTLNSYKEASARSFIFFTQDGNELMIRFGFFKNANPILFNGENFPDHNQLTISDSELIPYLRRPETYRKLHKNYLSQTLEILWLKELTLYINEALELFEKETYD